MTDNMVSNVAAIVADGIDLVDRVNRSGIVKALPAIASLVENGDLDRLVQLARLIGSAQDAMTDDMIVRLTDTAAKRLYLDKKEFVRFSPAVRFGIWARARPISLIIATLGAIASLVISIGSIRELLANFSLLIKETKLHLRFSDRLRICGWRGPSTGLPWSN